MSLGTHFKIFYFDESANRHQLFASNCVKVVAAVLVVVVVVVVVVVGSPDEGDLGSGKDLIKLWRLRCRC